MTYKHEYKKIFYELNDDKFKWKNEIVLLNDIEINEKILIETKRQNSKSTFIAELASSLLLNDNGNIAIMTDTYNSGQTMKNKCLEIINQIRNVYSNEKLITTKTSKIICGAKEVDMLGHKIDYILIDDFDYISFLTPYSLQTLSYRYKTKIIAITTPTNSNNRTMFNRIYEL